MESNDPAYEEIELKKIIWIAWERQRRSVSLAALMADEYFELIFPGPQVVRYFMCILRTTWVLFKYRKAIVIVQNPSMVLASYALTLRLLFRFRLVVDRHTDVYILNQGAGFVYSFISWVSQITLRYADLTIVTNHELAEAVLGVGGDAVVLPDPLPKLDHYLLPATNLTSGFSIFCVASWSEDEPLIEYLLAAKAMPDVQFFISGRPRSAYRALLRDLPCNVTCTGFLSDRDYYRVMASAHGVIALSSWRATLVCGGYEAVALGKPFITGNSQVLRDYFGPALHSDGSSADLVEKIRYMQSHYFDLQLQIQELHREKNFLWQDSFAAFQIRLMGGA